LRFSATTFSTAARNRPAAGGPARAADATTYLPRRLIRLRAGPAKDRCQLLWCEQHGGLDVFEVAGRGEAEAYGRGRLVVRGLDEADDIVLAEGVVQAVKCAAQSLYQCADAFGAILRILEQRGPRVCA